MRDAKDASGGERASSTTRDSITGRERWRHTLEEDLYLQCGR